MREIKFKFWDGKKMLNDHRDASIWNGLLVCEGDTIPLQFTGLKDKNGKEIFEGDVFKYEKHPSYLLDSFVSSFKWSDEFSCFGYEVKSEIFSQLLFSPLSIHDELQKDFLNHIEIIGNIYEKS